MWTSDAGCSCACSKIETSAQRFVSPICLIVTIFDIVDFLCDGGSAAFEFLCVALMGGVTCDVWRRDDVGFAMDSCSVWCVNLDITVDVLVEIPLLILQDR